METPINEEWRAVVGFESCYQVSNRGRVRRIAPGPRTSVGAILKPYVRYDYPKVTLTNKKLRKLETIHRMMAAAFFGPANGRHVNHLDGNKKNNDLANLEYVTPLENYVHAVGAGLMKTGERHHLSRLTDAQAEEIFRRPLVRRGDSARLAQEFSVTQSMIKRIKDGKNRRMMREVRSSKYLSVA